MHTWQQLNKADAACASIASGQEPQLTRPACRFALSGWNVGAMGDKNYDFKGSCGEYAPGGHAAGPSVISVLTIHVPSQHTV